MKYKYDTINVTNKINKQKINKIYTIKKYIFFDILLLLYLFFQYNFIFDNLFNGVNMCKK